MAPLVPRPLPWQAFFLNLQSLPWLKVKTPPHFAMIVFLCQTGAERGSTSIGTPDLRGFFSFSSFWATRGFSLPPRTFADFFGPSRFTYFERGIDRLSARFQMLLAPRFTPEGSFSSEPYCPLMFSSHPLGPLLSRFLCNVTRVEAPLSGCFLSCVSPVVPRFPFDGGQPKSGSGGPFCRPSTSPVFRS